MTTIHGLRPALIRFANAMEGRLREFDGKPGKRGWLSGEANTNSALLMRMEVHIEELEDFLDRVHRMERIAIATDETIKFRKRQAQEACLDAANYLMMICDRLSDNPIGDNEEEYHATSADNSAQT